MRLYFEPRPGGITTYSAIPAGRMAWERETWAQRCRVCRVPGQYGGGTPAASAARFSCTLPETLQLADSRSLRNNQLKAKLLCPFGQ